MKLIFSILISFSFTAFAQTSNKDVGAPPNPTSSGPSKSEGISDSPTGVSKKEKKQIKAKSESMGGAPNVGVGTGTGTGAGSTVGKKIEKD